MAEKLVQEQHCSTVNEFLSALSPRGPLFAEFGREWWVFRGHPNDRFELVPSALRREPDPFEPFGLRIASDNREQVFHELVLLQRFFDGADSVGLELPEDSQALRSKLELDPLELPHPWPPHEILSLMAIAQHHGLPTRLLDWSRNRLVAAYFAARAIADESPKPERISVWAMMVFGLAASSGVRRASPIRIVTAPSATNPNLKAQEGIFTLVGSVVPSGDPIDRRPLDQLLSEHAENMFMPIFRITLPFSESAKLLWELQREGVSHRNIFPDYYGIVNGLKEQTRLQEQLQ